MKKSRNPAYSHLPPIETLGKISAVATAIALSMSIDRLVQECKKQKRALRVSIEVMPAPKKKSCVR